MKTLYAKTVIEEIIRLQANGFSAEETRAFLKEEKNIEPALNTIYKHRRSPIGHEMLMELIRHQERSILKADSTNPALAMKYRADLISKIADKVLPDLVYSRHEEDVNIVNRNVIQIDNLNADERQLLDSVARKYIKSSHTDESSSIH